MNPAEACDPGLPLSILRGDGIDYGAPEWLPLAVPEAPIWRTPRLLSTATGEVLDAEAALARAGLSEAERAPILAEYAHWVTDPVHATFPYKLPDEFRRYRLAADAAHHGRDAEAIAALRAFLALPPAKRHWRSTWAAYTLGNLEANAGRRDAAVAAWQQVRALASAGSPDTLGLAYATLRREGGTLLPDAPDKALPLCAAYQLAGGQQAGCPDWRDLAHRVLEAPDATLARAVRNPDTRRAVHVAIASYASTAAWSDFMTGTSEGPLSLPFGASRTRWLRALERAGVKDVEGLEYVAHTAYEVGNYEEAARWAARAPRTAPLAIWTRFRLARRAGSIDRALRIYWEFGPDEGWRSMHLEAGLAFLRAGRIDAAAEALARGDSWIDAAYLAERVLTIDELRRVADRMPGGVDYPRLEPDDWRYVGEPFGIEHLDEMDEPEHAWRAEDFPRAALRHLLARRLAREGRWKEALPYYPREVRAVAEQVVPMAEAHDRSWEEADPERTFALAVLIRRHGMELLGTELEPDWHIYEGDYTDDEVAAARLADGVSPAEAARLRATPTPTERFHYRRIASELAWEAAAQLPDGDPRTVQALCRGGRWLANRHPKDADRFYTAMVLRGRPDPVAVAADAARWFPAVDVEGNCLDRPVVPDPPWEPEPGPGPDLRVSAAIPVPDDDARSTAWLTAALAMLLGAAAATLPDVVSGRLRARTR